MIETEPWQCWCGSTAATLMTTFTGRGNDQFPLMRCEGCGVQALHPQPDDATLLSYYASDYYGRTRRKFVGPLASIFSYFQAGRARRLARLLPRGGRLLDVGCGNGDFLMQMQRRGFIVEGTEWTADSAVRVPAERRIPVHVGDVLTLNLPKHSYDMITMWHVLEHVRQPYQTLQSLHELLKPGGTLVLALPNVESDQARRFGSAWLHYDPPRHLFNFGIQSLRRLLDDTGFVVRAVSTHAIDQNAFGFVQSWLNERGSKHGVPRDRLYALLRGQRHGSRSAAWHDLLCFAALATPAAIVSTLEAIRGRGATMIVRASA